MQSTKIDLNKTTIVYIAEGNANIVLKLPEYMKVVRLPKTEKENETENLALLNFLQQSVRYSQVIAEILGHYCIPVSEIIDVSPEELAQINNCIQKRRPVHRIDKGLNSKFGLLLSDATVGVNSNQPTYAVEIKPKQGWLIDDSVAQLFQIQGVNRCRYCCMQFLKKSEGKVSRRSKYCPMDLFSGNISRMHNAINSLLETPQNNLRIFKNGYLIFAEDCNNFEVLSDILNELGENNFHKLLLDSLVGYDVQYDELFSQTDKIKKLDCKPEMMLPSFSILQKILGLQLLAKAGKYETYVEAKCGEHEDL